MITNCSLVAPSTIRSHLVLRLEVAQLRLLGHVGLEASLFQPEEEGHVGACVLK